MTDRYFSNSPNTSDSDNEPTSEKMEVQEQIPSNNTEEYIETRYIGNNPSADSESENENLVNFIPLERKHKPQIIIPESKLGLVLKGTKFILGVTKNPTLVLVAVILGSLICLYLYFQIIAFVNMIAAYPSWLLWPLVGILAILLAVTLISIVKLYLRMRGLRVVKQGRTSDVEALLKHKTLIETGTAYQKANEKKDEIYEMLLDYIKEYPENIPEMKQEIPEWHDKKNDTNDKKTNAKEIEELRNKLARGAHAHAHYHNKEAWLNDYKEFQKKIDQLAEKRLGECARWVGFKTAISPYAVMDMLITVYWSFRLIEDLCTIYNVRLGKVGLLVLFCQVVGAIFLVGKIDEAEKYTEAAFEDLIVKFLDNDTLKWVLGKVAAKAVSGFVNYYIIKRIGKYAMSELKPLRLDH